MSEDNKDAQTNSKKNKYAKKRLDVRYPFIDFEKLDKNWQFKNKEEKVTRAKLLGFNTIHEAYVGLYEKYNSTIVVGDIMGVGASSIIKVLQRANIPLGKRGGSPRVTNISIPEKDILKKHGFKIGVASAMCDYSKK